MTNKTLQEKNISATSLRGIDVLNNPVLNKGTAFNEQERENSVWWDYCQPVSKVSINKLSGCLVIWSRSRAI